MIVDQKYHVNLQEKKKLRSFMWLLFIYFLLEHWIRRNPTKLAVREKNHLVTRKKKKKNRCHETEAEICVFHSTFLVSNLLTLMQKQCKQADINYAEWHPLPHFP